MAHAGHLELAIRPQRAERLQLLAVGAERQHGVIAHHQLRRLGFSNSAIQRLLASGHLHAIHRGVYAVGHRALPAKGRFMAAALAGGVDAVIGWRSAAGLREVLQDSRAVIDVLSPRRRRSRDGVRFHRSPLAPEDRGEVDNIPVTSLARTLLDIAAVIPQRTLVYAIEHAEKLRVLDLREIDACIARNHGHHGTGRLREAIGAVEPEAQYAHEGLERDFIAFCRQHELEVPTMNAVVEGFTVDALWPQQKLIVELDSWAHHRSRHAFEEDRRRDLALKLAGYDTLRLTDRSLKDDPIGVAATLRSLLDRG